jgi:hypothetical protein
MSRLPDFTKVALEFPTADAPTVSPAGSTPEGIEL